MAKVLQVDVAATVLSLGSIAHLQYYFARTGLLDGKGGQVAEDQRSRITGSAGVSIAGVDEPPPSSSLEEEESVLVLEDSHLDARTSESPVNLNGSSWETQAHAVLPPTVSTYNQKAVYVPSPPDTTVLRAELREALDETREILREAGIGMIVRDQNSALKTAHWDMVKGLKLLEIVTLNVRAARMYYTSHGCPQRLYCIRPEREIRADLHQVFDTLCRIVSRDFAGGVRSAEIESIWEWTAIVDELLAAEEAQERLEKKERETWSWRQGDWTGREREREWLFLDTFDLHHEPLPHWDSPIENSQLPTPFLRALRNGLRLIQLHNELVMKSRRRFEMIENFHTDTSKPYRCADNLRYWVKAAQLRWEVKLDVDVLGVLRGNDDTAWRKFDEAVLQWCRRVREEISTEWENSLRNTEDVERIRS
ncbi:hypothetical protein B0A49_03284 [Cryomyces minteri]|uniref:Uncharacterized protein n=1 Tax=Cryomyces minteri TaxID=331657 RepID=A0A4U0XQV0_9PEZI|nr:hypothetical protein B0A49_03284 [Cryomyces minteri]